MKYLAKFSLLTSAAAIALLPVLVAVHLVGAAGNGAATLYLAPASNTVARGATLDVAIHEDSGSDQVNGVHAVLNYPSSLTFTSIDNSNDFSVAAQSTGGGGTVTVDRGTCGPCGPVTGDKVVATVHFTANQAGSAAINFDSSSVVVRSTDNQSEAMSFTGGSYNITSPATMTLSPATKTVSQGSSLDVAIYEDSSTDGVNGVQANLTYPSNQLAYAGVTNSSAWPIDAQSTASGGVVKIGRSISGGSSPLTGRQLVATLKFNAVGTGNPRLDFTTGTGLIRASDNSVEPTNNTGGSYIVTSVSPPSSGGTTKNTGSAAPPPKSVTGSVSKPASPGGPVVSTPVTTPVDTKGPAITDINVTNLTTSSATVNWRTSEPATSEVDYGLSTNYILSSGDSNLATNHSIKLDSKELVGHKTYHFVVKSTDAAGNKSVSKDMKFSTGGIQITTKEIVAVSAAAILGGGAWIAAAGGLKLGGGMMVAPGGGIYVEPKPIIVGGGAPPPTPVIHPQSASQPAQAAAKAAPEAPQPQTPGKVVGPKNSPASDAGNQTLPKWVKK